MHNDENMCDAITPLIASLIASMSKKSTNGIKTVYGPQYLVELEEMDSRREMKEQKRRENHSDIGKHYIQPTKPKRLRNTPSRSIEEHVPVFLLEKGAVVFPDMGREESGLFYGLRNSHLTIMNKVNKVKLIKCTGVRLNLLGGCISGLEIVNCKDVFIDTSFMNYTNIEGSIDVNISGDCDVNTRTVCRGCISVTVNGERVNTNPFILIALDGYMNRVDFNVNGWNGPLPSKASVS